VLPRQARLRQNLGGSLETQDSVLDITGSGASFGVQVPHDADEVIHSVADRREVDL
jgi:hypothetical protein